MDISLLTDALVSRLAYDYGLHPLSPNKYEENTIDIRTSTFLIANYKGRTNILVKCDLTELPPFFD